MYSAGRTEVLPQWVSPFGNPRIIMPVCGSPGLIAACHVLHRLLLPRHPPCALSNLTIKFTQCTSFTAPAGKLYAPSPDPLIAERLTSPHQRIYLRHS